MIYVAQSECLEHQRKYQTQCCQCCVLHRLLRGMYRISAIVETFSALLLWSGHGNRHLVLAYHYDPIFAVKRCVFPEVREVNVA